MKINKTINLITVGYAKRALQAGTREWQRMKQYSDVLGELHVIVFTRKFQGFPSFQQSGNLFLYATNARTRLGMMFSARRIGRSIITSDKSRDWVVSGQDPFEASIVSRAISFGCRVDSHVQVHGDVFNPLSFNASFMQRIRVLYGKYVIRHTNGIRVVSNRIKSSIEALGVDSGLIAVLPIQADLENFSLSARRRDYDNKSKVSFLYVGRFSEEKNIRLLITAFKVVADEFKGPSLTLVGEGALHSDMNRQIRELNLESRVFIQGWTDEVPSLMLEHDVLCVSSNHEGWAMVILEAAATGMPIITTDVGCAGEVVVNDDNGQIVQVGSVSEYVKALRLYIHDPSLVKKHGKNSLLKTKSYLLSKDEYLDKLVISYSDLSIKD